MRNGHVAMRGQVLLTKSPKSVWEREKERGREQTERERDLFRERSSTFSLKFPTIGPSASDEARSKVAPHGKDYAWVPVLGSLNKLQKRYRRHTWGWDASGTLEAKTRPRWPYLVFL